MPHFRNRGRQDTDAYEFMLTEIIVIISLFLPSDSLCMKIYERFQESRRVLSKYTLQYGSVDINDEKHF
jgi:hypothetical protein